MRRFVEAWRFYRPQPRDDAGDAMMLVRRTAAFTVAALMMGCAAAPRPVGSAAGIQTVRELPPPEAMDVARSAREFVLGPGDKVTIDVFGVPELRRTVTVDTSGAIAFPLIGTVSASGRPPVEVSSEIAARLRERYVKKPEVTLNVDETPNRTITVDGEVVKPGLYEVTGMLTLQRAVALAGGTAEFAKLDDVIVRRQVGTQTYVGIYNLGAIRRGNYPDPNVYPTDVVVVGDSVQRRRYRELLQVAPLLTTPLILLTQNGN